MKALIFFKSYKRWLIVALFLAAAYFSWTKLTARQGDQKVSFIPAAQTCHSAGRLKYCVYRARSGTNGDIVYHLHGRNLDEQIWNDDTYWTSMVQANWQRSNALPPTVVVVSFGPTWLLAPKGRLQESGLLDEFISKLPEIEKNVGIPKRRMLLGESMGGLNVLIAGLSYPNSFVKIASLCPGVYATSPFASFSEMRRTLERTGADPKIGFGVWLLAKKYVDDETEWKRINPLDLVKRADEASRRGVLTEWHPLYGGHCAIDTSSLARFLVS